MTEVGGGDERGMLLGTKFIDRPATRILRTCRNATPVGDQRIMQTSRLSGIPDGQTHGRAGHRSGPK